MATRTRAWLNAGDGHCLFPEGSGGGHEGFAWNSPLGPSALRREGAIDSARGERRARGSFERGYVRAAI